MKNNKKILNLYKYKHYSTYVTINNYDINKTFKYFKIKKGQLKNTYKLINDIHNNKNNNTINENIKYYNNNINNKKRLNLLLLYKYYYKNNILKQHKKNYTGILTTII